MKVSICDRPNLSSPPCACSPPRPSATRKNARKHEGTGTRELKPRRALEIIAKRVEACIFHS